MQNIRTFAQRSPMFCVFRPVLLKCFAIFPKKSFVKISYISYTRHGKVLYRLAFSGVG